MDLNAIMKRALEETRAKHSHLFQEDLTALIVRAQLRAMQEAGYEVRRFGPAPEFEPNELRFAGESFTDVHGQQIVMTYEEPNAVLTVGEARLEMPPEAVLELQSATDDIMLHMWHRHHADDDIPQALEDGP